MLAIDIQRSNEYAYCKQHHDKYMLQALRTDPALIEKVDHGVLLANEWLNKTYYDTKQARLDQLKQLDMRELIEKIFSQIAYYINSTTFVTVVAQISGYVGFSDRKEAILTMGELLAVLSETNAFDINKASRYASLMLQSRLVLPPALLTALDRGMYPLPMVVEPKNLSSNYQSPYLTFNEGAVLGKQNNHDGDLSLDVLNTQNQTALCLNTAFLEAVEEVPNAPFEVAEQQQLWEQFKLQSQLAYQTMIQQGNHFYLTHRPDKRGRIYAQGYHITTQGSAYKKASIELKHQETVQGVPHDCIK